MIAGNIGTGLLFLGLVLSLRDIYANSEKKPTEKTNFEDEEFVMEFGDEKTKSTDLPDEEELPVRKPTAQFTAPHTIKNLPDMQFLFWFDNNCLNYTFTVFILQFNFKGFFKA